MKKLAILGIAALAFSTAASAVWAAPTATKASSGNSAGQAAFDHLNARLVAAEGISYRSTLYYAIPAGPRNTRVTKQTNTVVTVERPAKISIKASKGTSLLAVASSTGAQFTIYDATTSKYAQESTTADLQTTLGALGDTGRVVFSSANDSGESLRAALGFPLGFLNGEIDIQQAPPGGTLSYSEEKMVVGGIPVLQLTETLSAQQYGSLKIIFQVAESSGLPTAQIIQSLPRGTQTPITVMKELYTGFKILRAPAPASTYAFTPPANATQVALAPQPAPMPMPPIPPTPPVAPGSTAPAAPGTPAPSGPTNAPASPAPTMPASPAAPAPPASPGATPPAPPL